MKYYYLLFIVFTLINGSCTSPDKSSGDDPPNIIYILADDLGIGDLGCYGQTRFATPNVDFLAENGMRFTRHYSGSTVCAPSRSVLMTGQHTGHTPIRGNKKMPLPDSSVTVAEILKEAGYTTGVFGKWSLGLLEEYGGESHLEGYPTNQGFDVFFGYDNQTLAHRYYPDNLKSNESVVPLPGNDGVHTAVYAPDLIHENLMDFIDSNKDRPFFLYYATIIPHAELILPNDTLFNKFKGKFPETPFEGNDYGAENFRWGGYCSVEYPNATYAAMITLLDIYVGRIIEKLREEELLDNTLILFTSDNGATTAGGRDPEVFNSTAGLRGLKRDLFEGGIRAPLLACWKGKIAPGSESDHISSFEDVLPTLAEVAGSRVPEGVDGISFLPVLLGKKQKEKHEYLYWEFPEKGGKVAIRKDNWKAVRVDVSTHPDAPVMLFDLEKDPCEERDVSAEFPDIVEEMLALMQKSRTISPHYPLFSFCEEKEADVWVASPWQRVMRGSAPEGPASASLRAASNEYEPFRLIIHNGGKEKLTGLTVEAGDLRNGSHVVPAANISLYRAYYLHVNRPSKRTENPAGWYPDALIPFQDQETGNKAADREFIAAPFEVDAGQNTEVWCDLFVPAGTPPGVYRGKVKVYSGKRKLAVVPVELTVRDFELPDEITMRSNFGPLRDRNLEFMGMEPESPEAWELEALYHEALVNHRAMPGTPDHYWPEWNEAEGITENGEAKLFRELVEEKHVTALDIPLRYEDDPSMCRAWLSAVAEWLREIGYLDLAYVYLEDEPNSAEEYEIVRRQGSLIESANPEIDRLCTEQTIPTKLEWGDLYGAVDIWCPLWGLWDEETSRQRLAKGEELWSYTALCQGAAGTPWWQIDMDPLNFRSPFWLSWHYDITGFLYWSSTYWSAYGSLEGVWRGPHFREDFWGEGMLLYPGQPAGIDGFVPSIRLKLIREALEEYEYMVMAAGLGHEDEVNRIINGVVSDFQQWSRNPADYHSAREKLAELISYNK